MEKIKRRGENYTIPQIDLSVEPKNTKEEFKYLYENVTVEKKGGYLGHPDSVLLKDGSILVFFPEGHGKGKTLSYRGNQKSAEKLGKFARDSDGLPS